MRKASINLNKARYLQAIQYFQEAIRLNPDNVGAYNGLAVSYLNTGNMDRGMTWLAKAISVDNKNPETYRLMGIVFYRNNDYHNAIDNLKKSLYFDPDNAESMMHLSIACYLNRDQACYESTISKLSRGRVSVVDTTKFAVTELSRHGYFKEANYLFENTKSLFTK